MTGLPPSGSCRTRFATEQRKSGRRRLNVPAGFASVQDAETEEPPMGCLPHPRPEAEGGAEHAHVHRFPRKAVDQQALRHIKQTRLGACPSSPASGSSRRAAKRTGGGTARHPPALPSAKRFRSSGRMDATVAGTNAARGAAIELRFGAGQRRLKGALDSRLAIRFYVSLPTSSYRQPIPFLEPVGIGTGSH